MRTSRMAALIPSASATRTASSMVRQGCTWFAPAPSSTSSRSIKSRKSSSTISSLAPARARAECWLSELCMIQFLWQGQLDGAHEALRQKFAPRNPARDPLVNQVAAQPVIGGLRDTGSAYLFPDNAEVVVAVPCDFPPGDTHLPAPARQRAVLGGVRRQLM